MSENTFADNEGDTSQFVARSDALHQWIRDRLYLCGGWSPELDRQYTPRVYGYYRFDAACSAEMRRVAIGLGRLYSNVGAHMGELIRDRGLPDDWPLDYFGPHESALITSFRHENNWATTLRADVVLDASGQPRIVEVNSDNVGGLEDLLMMLGHFASDNCAGETEAVRGALRHLQDSYLGWVRSQYNAYRRRCGLSAKVLEESTIAIVADDLENSSALTRVLAAFLHSHGIDARPCRPAQLRRRAGTLEVADELGAIYHPVDIVLRDMLWHELFDDAHADARARLKPQTGAMLEAARHGEVLLLNPPTERLLFSKAILAELCTSRHGMFNLDAEDQDFVARYMAHTEYFDAAGQVLKPSSLYGGQGVFMLGRVSTHDRAGMPWVLQSRVAAERVRTLYRKERETPPTLRDLFVVHGLLVYGAPDAAAQLAGVMTRIGPDPVVNFSRGAQIVPGVLT